MFAGCFKPAGAKRTKEERHLQGDLRQTPADAQPSNLPKNQMQQQPTKQPASQTPRSMESTVQGGAQKNRKVSANNVEQLPNRPQPQPPSSQANTSRSSSAIPPAPSSTSAASLSYGANHSMPRVPKRSNASEHPKTQPGEIPRPSPIRVSSSLQTDPVQGGSVGTLPPPNRSPTRGIPLNPSPATASFPPQSRLQRLLSAGYWSTAVFQSEKLSRPRTASASLPPPKNARAPTPLPRSSSVSLPSKPPVLKKSAAAIAVERREGATSRVIGNCPPAWRGPSISGSEGCDWRMSMREIEAAIAEGQQALARVQGLMGGPEKDDVNAHRGGGLTPGQDATSADSRSRGTFNERSQSAPRLRSSIQGGAKPQVSGYRGPPECKPQVPGSCGPQDCKPAQNSEFRGNNRQDSRPPKGKTSDRLSVGPAPGGLTWEAWLEERATRREKPAQIDGSLPKQGAPKLSHKISQKPSNGCAPGGLSWGDWLEGPRGDTWQDAADVSGDTWQDAADVFGNIEHGKCDDSWGPRVVEKAYWEDGGVAVFHVDWAKEEKRKGGRERAGLEREETRRAVGAVTEEAPSPPRVITPEEIMVDVRLPRIRTSPNRDFPRGPVPTPESKASFKSPRTFSTKHCLVESRVQGANPRALKLALLSLPQNAPGKGPEEATPLPISTGGTDPAVKVYAGLMKGFLAAEARPRGAAPAAAKPEPERKTGKLPEGAPFSPNSTLHRQPSPSTSEGVLSPDGEVSPAVSPTRVRLNTAWRPGQYPTRALVVTK